MQHAMAPAIGAFSAPTCGTMPTTASCTSDVDDADRRAARRAVRTRNPLRGFFASLAGTSADSNPPNANISSSTACCQSGVRHRLACAAPPADARQRRAGRGTTAGAAWPPTKRSTAFAARLTPVTLTRGDDGENHDHHHGAPERRRRPAGSDLREVVDEHVEVRRHRGDADPEGQPARLEADEPAEGLARVEVDATRLVEPARHLAEAEDDRQDGGAREDVDERAPNAGEGGDRRRHAEDRAADDGVDDRCGEVDAGDRPDEVRLRRAGPAPVERHAGCLRSYRTTPPTIV